MTGEGRDEIHARGMGVRRAVLGDAHVDRAIERTTPFTEDFQDLITRYAWGEIWTRPGLPRHTRSLLTVGLMVALNRSDEFKLHVRAAFNNGVTRDEIREVLLHCAIYAGVPAANTAFTHTLAILREVGEQIGYVLEPTAPAASAHPAAGAKAAAPACPPCTTACASPALAARHAIRLY